MTHKLVNVVLTVSQKINVGPGSILTKLLLDDGENLLAAELRRNALNSGQGLAAISLCWRLLSACCFGFGEAPRCRPNARRLSVTGLHVGMQSARVFHKTMR